MDDDQKRAVDLAISGKSFFLTGAGGTGKSYVIRSIVEALNRSGRDVYVTAMTGCAALLLGKRAKTLHSWAGIGLGKESAEVLAGKVKKSFKSKKNWMSADTLIIDEVSMMTPVLLDKLDFIGRAVRKMKTMPFGGLQVILVGDLFQLPPVNKGEDYSFVFESEFWKQHISETIILNTIHRQSDPVFLKVLQEARMGKLSQESIAILETRKTKEWKKLEIKPTLLFTRRSDVDEINMTQLKKCDGPDVQFKAKTVYSPTAAFSVKPSEQEMQWAVEKMDKNGSYVVDLSLRVGSQVMLLTNSPTVESEDLEMELKDIESRPKPSDIIYTEWNKMKKEITIDIKSKRDKLSEGLVNGSRGVIEGFTKCDKHYPIVKFRNGDIRILKSTLWASEDYEGLNREQIPLRLAYAVTIHKAQGATLDCALIDIGDNTFEYGQAYVALSRVKSLESLYIWDLKPSAFTVHPKVQAFFQSVSDQMSPRSADCTDDNASVSDEPLTPEVA